MSTGTRVALAEAQYAAARLVALLRSACERVEIAGSVRRGRPDVGDIELVAQPRVEMETDGMWDARTVNRLTDRIDKLLVDGDLMSHPTDPKRGERYSKVVHRESGLQVDLFSANPDGSNFGLIFLIRTGPAAYSQRFVTDLRRRGLHVAGGQLHRGAMGCGSYVCEVIPTPEETDVYAEASWPFVRPEFRA